MMQKRQCARKRGRRQNEPSKDCRCLFVSHTAANCLLKGDSQQEGVNWTLRGTICLEFVLNVGNSIIFVENEKMLGETFK